MSLGRQDLVLENGIVHNSNACPTYGTELNTLFLDVINDVGFEQLVTSPTRNNHVLDLVFSTHSTIIDLNIVPGMSDHEAITFHVDTHSRINYSKTEHKVALYHKANLENIKRDLLEFQAMFFENDPYSKSVEQNWTDFKKVINDTIIKMSHIRSYVLVIACPG